MRVRVGINGLGRIGRTLLRLAWDDPGVEVAAINDVADPPTLAHLLRHDSVAGPWKRGVEGGNAVLRIGDREIPCTSRLSPAEIPWKAAGVEVAVEATGRFKERRAAEGHLRAGAGWVIISSPAAEADFTAVPGLNLGELDPERQRILSNGSCTSQCVAPLLALLDRGPGVEAATMTTVHCYTNDQPLMDAPHRDRRRARAAGLSMIPTTTSAAIALEATFPRLAGRIACLAVRVPTAFVSAADLVVSLQREIRLPELREIFREATRGELAGILGYEEEELVSVDYRGDSRSAVVDGPLLSLPAPRLARVFAWYDNESGYSHRMLDLIRFLSKRTGGGR